MGRRLSEKDSGVVMKADVGKGDEGRERKRERERANRDSVHDESGFLKSSPVGGDLIQI